MEMLHLCSCHDQIPRAKPTNVCPSASLLTFPFCEYVNFLEKCKINYCISVPARKFWNLKGLIFSWIALKGSVIDKYSKFAACHIITRSGLINWRRESQSACVISFISRGEGILFYSWGKCHNHHINSKNDCHRQKHYYKRYNASLDMIWSICEVSESCVVVSILYIHIYMYSWWSSFCDRRGF